MCIRDRNSSARDQQICDVLGHKAAEGNFVIAALGQIAALGAGARGVMDVDHVGKAADCVGKARLIHHVLAGEHIFAHDAAGFSCAGLRGRDLKIGVFKAGNMIFEEGNHLPDLFPCGDFRIGQGPGAGRIVQDLSLIHS